MIRKSALPLRFSACSRGSASENVKPPDRDRVPGVTGSAARAELGLAGRTPLEQTSVLAYLHEPDAHCGYAVGSTQTCQSRQSKRLDRHLLHLPHVLGRQG